MKKSFPRKTIITAMILLGLTAAHAVEQNSPAAPAAPTPAENAASAAGPAVKNAEKDAAAPAAVVEGERANLAGSTTITMKVPLFSPAFANVPIAVVNDENIAMEELTNAIAAMHEGMAEQKTAVRKNYSDILNRLINVKLLVQEGENIELDKLPEISNMLDTFEKTTLREILFQQRVKDVKVDEKEVERRYRERIREWKIAPLRFAKEADAKKFALEVKKGKSFSELAEKAIKEGLANGSKEAVFTKTEGLQPEIMKAVAKLKGGSVTPVIPVESGFAIVKFEEARFPENPQAKEEVRQTALGDAKKKALGVYRDELIKKYVKIDAKLLKKIDFEAPTPGFKNLQNDKRIIAEIAGEKPVTVADLAAAMNAKFFHGMATPIKEKQVNILKPEILDVILQKRVFHKEALRQGVDKGDEYLKRFRAYKEQVIFGTFVEKVLRKEVVVTEEDLQAYYREHSKDEEYIYPEMVRMAGLAFTSMEAAQAGIEKLKQGVDFKWLKTTAEGQAPENDPNLLQFTGNLVASTTLPDGLRKLLTGVRSGDVKLYADPAGHYYAIQILDLIPQREKTYEEAREAIFALVYNENFKKALDAWTKKLREAADIKIYVDFGEIS